MNNLDPHRLLVNITGDFKTSKTLQHDEENIQNILSGLLQKDALLEKHRALMQQAEAKDNTGYQELRPIAEEMRDELIKALQMMEQLKNLPTGRGRKKALPPRTTNLGLVFMALTHVTNALYKLEGAADNKLINKEKSDIRRYTISYFRMIISISAVLGELADPKSEEWWKYWRESENLPSSLSFNLVSLNQIRDTQIPALVWLPRPNRTPASCVARGLTRPEVAATSTPVFQRGYDGTPRRAQNGPVVIP